MLRRLVTIPAVWLGTSLLWAFAPALLLLAALADAVRGRFAFSSVRVLLFLLAFGGIECAGILALAIVGLGGKRRRLEHTYAVQRLYTAALFHSARALLSLKFEVEGDGLIDDGPLLVLMQHTSIVDTVLPGVFLSGRHGLKLRYVLKRELRWGPCLDIAGSWLPNHFVTRGGADQAQEIAAVAALKTGLGPKEGVILYPEGTRFSSQKKDRALAKLDPALRARAAKLRHLMPPRLGGSLALLSAQPACDVLLLGHHGLAGFASISDIWAGKLIGSTIRLRFFRIPAAQVPAERAQQIAFLYDAWEQVDAWLDGISREASRAVPGR